MNKDFERKPSLWRLIKSIRHIFQSGVRLMASVKEQMIQIIESQPPDSSWEEILRELAFERMVERGIDDAQAGRVISHEEMGRRIESWAK